MKAPEVEIQQSLNDPRLQLAIYTATGRLIDNRANVVSAAALPDYQALRDEANALKKHTIENLDHYLEQLESNVTAHGGKVVYCRTGQEAADFLLTSPQWSVTPALAAKVFGPPAHTYHFQAYTIMVWRKNLLPHLGRPVP